MLNAHHLITNDWAELAPLLRAWKAQWPGCGVLVLLPEAELARVTDVQTACQQHQVPLLGGVFPALVTPSGFASQGAWVLRFNDMPAHFLLDSLNGDPVADALAMDQQVDRLLQKHPQPEPAVFMVFDGILPHIDSLLMQLHQGQGNDIYWSGVNAGSESFTPMPCLFDQQRLVSNAVMGWLLPGPTRTVVRHGYPVSRSLLKATSAVGNRIDTIDGRPALSVYREVVRAEYGVELTRDNFYELAVHFPFGVVTALDVLVRIPVAFGDDESIICAGEVPPSSSLRLLRAPAFEDSHCIDSVSQSLVAQASDPGHPLLVFYCAGRRMHFGAAALKELDQLREQTATPELVGALTLGEIDSMQVGHLRFARFHNATVVCLR